MNVSNPADIIKAVLTSKEGTAFFKLCMYQKKRPQMRSLFRGEEGGIRALFILYQYILRFVTSSHSDTGTLLLPMH